MEGHALALDIFQDWVLLLFSKETTFNTHYTLDLIKNLPRGIPKPEKNHTVPFSIQRGT